jgi:hypothetical protein
LAEWEDLGDGIDASFPFNCEIPHQPQSLLDRNDLKKNGMVIMFVGK